MKTNPKLGKIVRVAAPYRRAAKAAARRRILYVSKTGNAHKPYRTIPAALRAARSGDIIEIAAGVYADGDMQLPDNITLRGQGQPTVLVGSTIYTKASHIVPGNNCVLDNLKISAAPGSVFVNLVGTTESAGEPAFTGFLGSNLWFDGFEDCYHIVHKQRCEAVFEDCHFASRWDNLAIAYGDHLVDARRCTFNSLYGSDQNSSGNQRNMLLGNGTIRLTDCEVNTTANAATMWPVAIGVEIFSYSQGPVGALERDGATFHTDGNAQSQDVVNRA